MPIHLMLNTPVIPATALNNLPRPERSATLPAGYPQRSGLRRSRKISKPTEKSDDAFHYVPGPRKRTTSVPQAVDNTTPPEHTEPIQYFVSLHGTNELHLGQLSKVAIEAIRNDIFSHWPHGLEVDELDGEVWRVKFRGTLWTFTGPDARRALVLLKKLFEEFSDKGWTFQTSVNFYLLYFSHTACRASLVDFPPRAQRHLVDLLQKHKVFTQPSWPDESERIQVIEMKKSTGFKSLEADSSHFLAGLLSSLDTLGFSLETAIPIAKKAPLSWFGIGPKQELFIFRSNQAIEK
ncbi:hypothetical protein K435DRAFT_149990 [Dendrothele bispora CBS 962.96]|uniref:Uncharacterized protein n=1 Tax=Dendrothele bispora (strain CBS 962.96) TaxID=1314807 RepID=A0A4V4HI30_DENBC|nr:hypothetical protein K435DRAFT_149990 [Dendrothele bispora CBS 962.96]